MFHFSEEDGIKLFNPIPRVAYFYGFAIIAIAIYLAWSVYGNRPQQPSAGFVHTKPAVSSPKITGPNLTAPLKVVPKTAVKGKFPDAHIDDPDEEVIDTADIEPAPNGATTITTMNIQTGESRTELKMKEAPWFALERQNYLGLGYELHFNGEQMGKVYYKRDLLRIKDAHLQAETVIRFPVNGSQNKVEGFVGVNTEWRFY